MGPKCQFNNYCPMTVLPICSKILERCIHSQLMNHLEPRIFVSQDQFGFPVNEILKQLLQFLSTLLGKIWTWVN